MNEARDPRRPVPSGTLVTMDEELATFALDPVAATDVVGPYCMVTLPCRRATLHRVLFNAPHALLEYLSEVDQDTLRCCLVTEVLAFGVLGLRCLHLPEECEAMARELLSGEDVDLAPRTRPMPHPVSQAGEQRVRESQPGESQAGEAPPRDTASDRLVIALLRQRVDRAFGFTPPAGPGRGRFLRPRAGRATRSAVPRPAASPVGRSGEPAPRQT